MVTMSTETHHPTPLDPDTHARHEVVRGEVTEAQGGSIDSTLKHQPHITEKASSAGTRTANGENSASVETNPRLLRREIKNLDKIFDGLVGDIAETGTKSGYLESQFDIFSQRMTEHGHGVNEKNRAGAEREEVRKLVRPLVEASGLSEEAREDYQESLVKTFHSYVALPDEERHELHAKLDERYSKAKELGEVSGNSSPEQTLSERLKDAASTSRRQIMGGMAVAGAGFSKVRSGERLNHAKEKAKKIKDEFLADMKGFAPIARKVTEKSQDYYLRAAYETGHLFDKSKQELSKKSKESNGRKVGETDEQYEKRMRRNGQFAWLGVVAITAAVLATRQFRDDLGFIGVGNDSDTDTNTLSAGHDRDGDGIINRFDHDRDGDDVLNGNDYAPNNPDVQTPSDIDGGPGADTLDRSEMFDGQRGTREFTAEGQKDFNRWISRNGGYEVKSGDSVWKLSERYLQANGNPNPTTYEVDAVKDSVLKEFHAKGLVDSNGWLAAGDTIKIK